jgi:hypothetical protein
LVALSAAACDAVDHPVGATDSSTGGNVASTGDSVSGTATATTGKVSGAGGSQSDADGAATTGKVSGTGGSANDADGGENSADGGENSADGGETGDGGDLPDDCTWVLGSYDGYECEVEVDCAGTPASSFCSTVDDYFECECLHTNPVQGFHLTGTTLDDACRLTLSACLSYPELEAGPYECLPSTNDVDEPDHCLSDAFCTREGVIGAANFTEGQERIAECFGGPSGWTCTCDSQPGLLFELPTPTSSPQCLDARDWCVGLDVERIGSRSCHVMERGEGEDICGASVECERAVTLSGQEAMMYEMDRVECSLVSEGLYQCRCSGEGPYTEVAAEDLVSACENGVSVCEGD